MLLLPQRCTSAPSPEYSVPDPDIHRIASPPPSSTASHHPLPCSKMTLNTWTALHCGVICLQGNTQVYSLYLQRSHASEKGNTPP